MSELTQNLRFGVRMLTRHATVTVISVLTLALGIGASTAVFSVVDSTLLARAPYEEPDRLVRLFTANSTLGYSAMTVSAPDYRDWSEQASSVEEVGIYIFDAVNVMGDEHADRLTAVNASAEVLRLLKIQPSLGRTFENTVDRPDAERVVLLSDTAWRQRFGSNPSVIGTALRIDDVPHEVIGVLPPETAFAIGQFDLWTPFNLGPHTELRANRAFSVIARLRQGVTLAEADRELKVICDRLAATYPESNRGYTGTVVSLDDVLLGRDSRPLLFALCAAVGFVLLIACVNIANLLLATATSREREFAVRTALGAGPRHLIRQLVTEAALMACSGGILGIAVAYWGVDIVSAALQETVGFTVRATVDLRSLGFSLVVLIVTSLGIGIPVALRASKARLGDAIGGGPRAVTGTTRDRSRRNLLVVGQVSLALALMICAGLMLRSLLVLKSVDPGFVTDQLLTMRVALPDEIYPSDSERIGFVEHAVSAIEAVPGVRSAAASSMIPLLGYNGNSSMSIEEHPISDPADKIFVGNEAATPGYLETMGIPLFEGRDFTATAWSDTPDGIIINRHMARHFWPEESAIGKRVKFGPLSGDFPWLEVIGVMGDYRMTSLEQAPRFETLYSPNLFSPTAMTFVVRTEVEPASLADAVQRAIQEVGPRLAVYQVATMNDILSRNTQSLDDISALLAGFGLVALVLALSGVYGMLSFTVGQKTREIGLRMALGAEGCAILGQILYSSFTLLLWGVLAGGLIAWIIGRWIEDILFEVTTLDPVVYFVVAAGMMAVGLLAGLIPALRASRVDPVIALRE